MDQPSHILVTGAGGYIGANVTKTLLDAGFAVTAANLDVQGIDPRARVIACNIFEERDDLFDFFGRPDACIHLAWRDGFNHKSLAHLDDLPKHYRFLSSLIKQGLRHLAVMGTMHETGYVEGAITAQTPTRPESLYGIAKNALRESLEALQRETPFTLQWLRAYYILGQDSRNNSVFTKIREKALAGEKTFPFTSGSNRYDFIDVEDLALEIALAATQQDTVGIINCASGQAVTLRETAESFIRDNGFDIQLEYGAFPDRVYDSPIVYGDVSDMKNIVRQAEDRLSDMPIAPRVRALLKRLEEPQR